MFIRCKIKTVKDAWKECVLNTRCIKSITINEDKNILVLDMDDKPISFKAKTKKICQEWYNAFQFALDGTDILSENITLVIVRNSNE